MSSVELNDFLYCCLGPIKSFKNFHFNLNFKNPTIFRDVANAPLPVTTDTNIKVPTSRFKTETQKTYWYFNDNFFMYRIERNISV